MLLSEPVFESDAIDEDRLRHASFELHSGNQRGFDCDTETSGQLVVWQSGFSRLGNRDGCWADFTAPQSCAGKYWPAPMSGVGCVDRRALCRRAWQSHVARLGLPQPRGIIESRAAGVLWSPSRFSRSTPDPRRRPCRGWSQTTGRRATCTALNLCGSPDAGAVGRATRQSFARAISGRAADATTSEGLIGKGGHCDSRRQRGLPSKSCRQQRGCRRVWLHQQKPQTARLNRAVFATAFLPFVAADITVRITPPSCLLSGPPFSTLPYLPRWDFDCLSCHSVLEWLPTGKE